MSAKNQKDNNQRHQLNQQIQTNEPTNQNQNQNQPSHQNQNHPSHQNQKLNQNQNHPSHQHQTLNQNQYQSSHQNQKLNQNQYQSSHQNQKLNQKQYQSSHQNQKLNQNQYQSSHQNQKLNQSKNHPSHKIQKIQNNQPNQENRTRMETDFELLKLLGKGGNGKVFQVKEKTTGKVFAMKVLLKKDICHRQTFVRHVMSEREVLTSHSSPLLCSLNYAFQSNSKLFLVMPFFPGGDLFSLMTRKGKFSEEDAKFYLAQVVLGVEKLHEMDVMYRDLKPDNVLLDHRGHCKLADFGLAKLNVPKGQKTGTYCGTLQYMAPEVVERSGHSYEVDWWAVGVLLFDLLIGFPPFHGSCVEESKHLIVNINPTIPYGVSPNARDLVNDLLTKEVSERIGGDEVKTHPFFEGFDWNGTQKMTAPFLPELETEYSTTMFGSEYTRQALAGDEEEPVGEEQDQVFAGFDYTS